MNLSLDQYIRGFERSVSNLPSVLQEDLDEDLCEEYKDQLEWLVQVRPDVLMQASAEGRHDEIEARLDKVMVALEGMRADLTKWGVVL